MLTLSVSLSFFLCGNNSFRFIGVPLRNMRKFPSLFDNFSSWMKKVTGTGEIMEGLRAINQSLTTVNEGLTALNNTMIQEFSKFRIDAGFTVEIAVRNQVGSSHGADYASKITLSTVPSLIYGYFNMKQFPKEVIRRDGSLVFLRKDRVVDKLMVNIFIETYVKIIYNTNRKYIMMVITLGL